MVVKVYSTPTCPWCKKAKEFLKKNNISFINKDVSIDEEAAKEMIDKSGQRGVPVIDFNGEIIVGFDEAKLSLMIKGSKIKRVGEGKTTKLDGKKKLEVGKKKKNKYSCDVLIVGSGVTGLATAMYTARFNLKPIVVGDLEGGTITLTDDVQNYPGFKKLTGTELAERVRDHALDYEQVEILSDYIIEIKKKGGKFVAFSNNSEFTSKVVILATGTKAKELGVKGEKELMGKGVHTCALCDGPFYKDKVVAVVGGSDSAAKEALLLSEHAKKVYIIYRGEKIRPEPINGIRVEKNKKIEIIKNTNILEFVGSENLEYVILDKVYKGKKEFKVDGVFIEIGHIPLSDLAKSLKVKLNKKGEVIINRKSETNVKGFYAAGDVADTEFKQAITGVSEGVTASYWAYQYIQNDV